MPQGQNSAPEPKAGTAPGPSSPPGTAFDASVETLIERLIHSPRYAAVSSVEIRAMTNDAIKSRCIARAASGASEGLILWAAVTADVGERLEKCAGPEAMALEKGAWRGGEALWLLEVFAGSESAVRGLVQAFMVAAGERPVRRGRGVPPPLAELAAMRTSSLEPPSWFDSSEKFPIQLTTPRNVLRRLMPQDAALVARWLTSDRMRTALGSPREDRTVEQTRELISSSHGRGQLLVALAPLERGHPEGFFVVSVAEEEKNVACLSLATGDRYPFQQEDVVDAACALIGWLFDRAAVSCVSSRVLDGNRVVMNWFRRYWPKGTLQEPVPGVFPTVHDFRVTREAWPATLEALLEQDRGRPWRTNPDDAFKN